MTTLEPGTEIMLTGRARDVSFNPNYGLVIRDLGPSFQGEWHVIVLWEDGVERPHLRADLMPWSELPKEIRP